MTGGKYLRKIVKTGLSDGLTIELKEGVNKKIISNCGIIVGTLNK